MGIRELNRKLQDFLRPKRLALGRFLWDRKNNSSFLWFLFNKEKPRLELKKIKHNNLIKEENIRSILFIRNDGKIGDMIINTLMFREIKKVYPGVKIGVVTRGANKQVIVNNPHVDAIYDYSKSDRELKNLAHKIMEEKYDLLIDFSEILRVKQMKFINLCMARVNMGLNKDDWNLFDVSVEYIDGEKHITNRYKEYLKILGIKNPNLSYDIHLSEENLKFGIEFRERIKEKKLICINPYGASKYRTLNEKKIKEIVGEILKEEDTAVTFVYSPDKLVELKKIAEEINLERVYLNEKIFTILDTASIIKVSDLIITPDTSIVHLGVALDKKMAAIYRSDEGSGELNSLVWGANSPKVKQIYAEPSLGENEEADINEFHVEEIELS
ncbi:MULTISPECIES: glycosyltransferase family 9 protein [Psychrilyobacter]|uniref:Lipopolysaccharide heptosyltransferase family protein n=1 Tax=Psychrilyobacter piezotolerans TaxID=2293438 RepID=A0ABX9KHI6_9FUSO|nr:MULTISPECIES: glycosyltransferase family 9 protein [Psychrilyobacter]MCS5422314.1 glycosyltransferase family 9 protein [Psychrilyobacter sp. S5]NDI77953.1 glycosyltransferase family 9 protein [Psychrilyobacter piezotolerans]RDE62068.1 lipopolysaccharide heptosyltransferase family protein [Psychrilyobacter sp. S5]REI41315.1 lipopolysaccharide heptosyltransferase family protein [Psychrilyobacter piezotolerans]